MRFSIERSATRREYIIRARTRLDDGRMVVGEGHIDEYALVDGRDVVGLVTSSVRRAAHLVADELAREWMETAVNSAPSSSSASAWASFANTDLARMLGRQLPQHDERISQGYRDLQHNGPVVLHPPTLRAFANLLDMIASRHHESVAAIAQRRVIFLNSMRWLAGMLEPLTHDTVQRGLVLEL